HSDGVRKQDVRHLHEVFEVPLGGDDIVWQVLDTGKPIVLDGSMETHSKDAGSVDRGSILDELNTKSLLCVPLRARERTLGAVLLGSSQEHRYGAPETVLAQDLARRAALAVDNALLYQAAQEEIDRRKISEIKLDKGRRDIEDLNERLRRAMVETHHRVKNNLQVIAALIDMHTNSQDHEGLHNVLPSLAAYVRTMAAVHDILTEESKESVGDRYVSGRLILTKLVELLQETSVSRKIVPVLKNVSLTPRQCTSLALLANELIANSLKHGDGDIYIRFSKNGDSAFLAVTDSGTGFPTDFNASQAGNTGIELVKSLVEWDLSGTITFENTQPTGAIVSVTFPLETLAEDPMATDEELLQTV
ncbi:MAG: histidine kinase dimerization/phosphoacceptor domain -containing protein, partial [Chthonomonadales bacterium]